MSGDDRHEGLDGYVRDLFATEDPLLRELREAMGREGLPEIHISPTLGRLLQLLLRSIGARTVLEIGTLGGYSALWMARTLPTGGRLVTLELEEERAAFTRGFLERAALDAAVEVRVGDARALLRAMSEGGTERFDAVFIDADKEGYPEYLDRSLELVRPGGMILADNAFRDGRVLDEEPDEATQGILEYNRRIAEDDRLDSTIVPIRDGLAVSLVRG